MQTDTISHRPPAEHDRPPKEGWRSILSTIGILLGAVLMIVTLTAFVFQSYAVEGPSMESTLHNRDRLIVWKLGKSWSSLTNRPFVPKRNDIVIFNRPNNAGAATDSGKHLIKRVIALPGERVVVSDGLVTVYNDANPDGFNPDTAGDYQIDDASTDGEVDLVVPAGKVFVMGDNRDNSFDSRNFGPIATHQIVGSLALRVYPFNKIDVSF